MQTFPLSTNRLWPDFRSHLPKLRWNAGWQFYGYGEDFHIFGYKQNYNAHTGFTSVLWSF